MGRWRVVDAEAGPGAFVALEPGEVKVRVRVALDEAGYGRVARLLDGHPGVELWIDNRATDLELLRHFPGLRLLSVTSLRLSSWEGLRHVADSLSELHMGDTLRPVSIAPMRQLRSLTALGLHGPVRDAEVIAELDGVVNLQLRSVTLPTLEPLLPMSRLRTLYIGLGGSADLSLLPRLTTLEELELWRIRGLRDLEVLRFLPGLRSLRLQSMSAITALPTLRNAASLRFLALDTMRGITNLAPIAEAPALEELLLVAMPQLEPESLEPLIGHPTLRRGVWGFGSTRKNVAAYDLLPLGDPPYGHPSWPEWMATQSSGSGSDEQGAH
jgi:internalin A